MEFREPQSRIEAILQNMLGANNVLLPPFSRNEKILLAIMGEEVELEEPQSPIEKCLMKWLGRDIELDEPMSNNERILHNIVGDEVEILPIQSVVEELLLEILRNSGEEVDIEGIPPLLLEKALAKALVSLTQYGLCTQDGTPSPDASVPIMCNNGAVKYGWRDIITTSQLSGYGTYVSPTATAGNRAYRLFEDLPNGTYKFAVDGDYELIVQWRDPADPSVTAQQYENLSGWMASGEVTLNKTSGGYGIAVRRTSGTDSITPNNFDGTIHVQEQSIFADGTPETISIGGKNLNGGVVEHKGYTSTGGESTSTTFAGTLWKIPCKAGQKFTVSWSGFPDGVSGVFINTWKTNGDWNTRQAISASTSLTYTVGAGIGTINFTLYKTGGVTIGENAWIQVEYGTTPTDHESYRTPLIITDIPMLLSVGDYADEAEIVNGAKTRRVGIKVMDGTEAVSASGAGWAIAIADKLRSKVAVMCTHYPYSSATMANAPDKSIIAFSSQNIGIKDSSLTSADAVKAMFAEQLAAGTPFIVVYPLAEEVEESIEPQIIELHKGDNLIDITAAISDIILNAKYIKGA